MVRIQPFRALRYAPGRVDLARVTSPPHDVVTPQQREACLRDPHSIVRLVLPTEGGEEGRFDQVASLLGQWQEDGVLLRDAAPAIYRYEVEHGPPGARRTMHGAFVRLGLDATMEQVRPHERTLGRKKGDRLRLRAATQCDLEPIWVLYRDEEARVDTLLRAAPQQPLVETTDADGATHRVWAIQDPATVAEAVAWFRPQTVVIADGHHRYQSALEHFAATGRPENASILACLVRDGDPGIQVEATHRVVRWGRSLAEAMAACRGPWSVRNLPGPRRASGSWAHAARALEAALEGPGTAVVVGKDAEGLRAFALSLGDRPKPGDLAVTLVQERLLAACWGLGEGQGGEAGSITYERDTVECLDAVARGAADLAVLLPPERVETVLDAARQGILMPAKATYFVPKPASGLVLAPLDEG